MQHLDNKIGFVHVWVVLASKQMDILSSAVRLAWTSCAEESVTVPHNSMTMTMLKI